MLYAHLGGNFPPNGFLTPITADQSAVLCFSFFHYFSICYFSSHSLFEIFAKLAKSAKICYNPPNFLSIKTENCYVE
ncbi:hypothetical protein C3Z13_08915 [Avibacterium endocarditidis]|uniref:Uncharacterized protein n=1 Tax=Avibacterium endocarditidis TaxID=380674 RepID=A0ABX4ZQZ5_9PAST|nr:hypothetical protein C3Z13_08915 [Avibacterium endocarditidis]